MNRDKANKLKDILGSDFSMTHEAQAKKMSKNVEKLQSNVEFYKAMIKSADALRMTMEVMDERGKSISSDSLANMIAGTLLMLEEKGFIDILRRKEK